MQHHSSNPNLWQSFGGSGNQTAGSSMNNNNNTNNNANSNNGGSNNNNGSSNNSGNSSFGGMSPPMRRAPSMHASNGNMLRRQLSSHKASNQGLSAFNSNNAVFSTSQQRLHQSRSSSGGMANAVFSNAQNSSSQGLNNNAIFSASQQRLQQQQQNSNSGVGGGSAMLNAVFPSQNSNSNNQNNSNKSTGGGGLTQRFQSSGQMRSVGGGSFSNLSSAMQNNSGNNSSSPLISALSRSRQGINNLQQQSGDKSQSNASSNPVSQFLSLHKKNSTGSLSVNNMSNAMNNAMGNTMNNSNNNNMSMASAMEPSSFSNSNRTSSFARVRLMSALDKPHNNNSNSSNNNNNNNNNIRNSVSMSAMSNFRSNGGGQNVSQTNTNMSNGSSSSIGSRLFPEGLPSNNSQQQFSRNSSSNNSNMLNQRSSQMASSASLTSRFSNSTSSLGNMLRSNKRSMSSAVHSNLSMLMGRNNQQQNRPQQNAEFMSLLQNVNQYTSHNAGNLSGQKRALSQSNLMENSAPLKVPRSATTSTARKNRATMTTDSLLHNSCKLYPKTKVVLESALAFDHEAIRRPVPLLVGNPEDKNKKKESEEQKAGGEMHLLDQFLQSGENNGNESEKNNPSFKTAAWYSYPFNIAMKHEAGLDVLDFLAKEGPDVLTKPDGDEEAGSLGIALGMEKPLIDTVRLILSHNPSTRNIPDRQSNFPLHIAVRALLQSPSDRLELVTLIYSAYPTALGKKNFRGETPLDIAVRSPFSCDEVIDFLQSKRMLDEEKDLMDAPIA